MCGKACDVFGYLEEVKNNKQEKINQKQKTKFSQYLAQCVQIIQFYQ